MFRERTMTACNCRGAKIVVSIFSMWLVFLDLDHRPRDPQRFELSADGDGPEDAMEISVARHFVAALIIYPGMLEPGRRLKLSKQSVKLA